jgi:arylsulfatase A-like enzyme
VEEIVPSERWHETKVCIANETRNVLFAPYSNGPEELEVARDGTIALGAIAEIDKVRPDAAAIGIHVQPLSEEVAEGRGVPADRYVPLPSERDASALAGAEVQLLGPGEKGRKVHAWAKEDTPLPQEWVSRELVVPASARLDFGIGIEEEMAMFLPCSVRFIVLVDCGGRRNMLFSQTVGPESPEFAAGWRDVSIDLSNLEGSKARFVFRTERFRDLTREGSGPVTPSFTSPVWSNPIVYSADAAKERKRRNVVLICLDTVRADHLGCYGYHRDTSPNIDRLAEEAVLFENCIAPSSWTLPSHASLFTGLHPSVHGAVHQPSGPPIRSEETALAELARAHGYLTAAYTEGLFVRAELGFSQGFELYSDGARQDAFGCPEETFNSALEWVEKYGELPFFLFVHTYQPHSPYTPPGRFGTMFDSDYTGPIGTTVETSRPSAVSSQADRVHIEALYDGEIAYTDEVVGVFLERLRRMRLLDNTVIIVISDHGEEFYDHGRTGHSSTLYDEQLRVPLLMRLAGEAPPSGRVTRQVSLTDLYATVCDILGIDHEIPPDCYSILPLIPTLETQIRYDREVVVSHLVDKDRKKIPKVRKWRKDSVRTNSEKYIVKSERSNRTEQLFGLREDPGEKNDIAADNQPRVEEYRKLLWEFHVSVAKARASLPTGERKDVPLTEEQKRRLKAVGYM